MSDIIFSVRRHEEKDGDALTNWGIQRAIYTGELLGQTIDPLLVNSCGYHSKAQRTRQTLNLLFTGAGLNEEYIQKNISESPLLSLDTSSIPKEELNEMVKLGDTELVNALLANYPEFMKRTGENVLQHIKNVYSKFKNENGPTRGFYIENVTHCPAVESALIQLVDPSLRDIKYFGGAFNQGENFRIVLKDSSQCFGHNAYLDFRGNHVKTNNMCWRKDLE